MGIFLTSVLMAQDPVNWTFNYDAEEEKLVIEADMQTNWVIYSQHTDPDGPIPTYFELEESNDFITIGEVEEVSESIKKMDELFGVEVIKFEKSASFVQKLKNVRKGTKIKGSVTYMTCDGERCLPPKTVAFEVKV